MSCFWQDRECIIFLTWLDWVVIYWNGKQIISWVDLGSSEDQFGMCYIWDGCETWKQRCQAGSYTYISLSQLYSKPQTCASKTHHHRDGIMISGTRWAHIEMEYEVRQHWPTATLVLRNQRQELKSIQESERSQRKARKAEESVQGWRGQLYYMIWTIQVRGCSSLEDRNLTQWKCKTKQTKNFKWC